MCSPLDYESGVGGMLQYTHDILTKIEQTFMKRTLFILGIFFMMGGPKAQSIADARKLLYYERYDGAARLLQALAKADPNNAETWWLLTQAYLQNGHVRSIRDSLQLMPATISQQPLALCAYGQVLLTDHKKDS